MLDQLDDAEVAGVAQDLRALGELAAPQAPGIDIVAPVMAAIAEAKNRPENVVPFRTRPKPNQPKLETERASAPWFRNLSAAAAALIIFSLGFSARDWFDTPESSMQAGNTAPTTDARPDRNLDEQFASAREPQTVHDHMFNRRIQLRERPEDPADTEREDLAEPEDDTVTFSRRPGMTDIFNARRLAMMEDEKGAEMLASLADWAALSPDEALQILQDMGYTPEAILGAIPFLSNAEAIGLLQGAIGKDPSNPLLRAALAENLMEAGEYGAGREQLAAWSQADRDNGLPAYYEAQMLFAEGDVDGALMALDNASNYGGVDTYSRARARSHEAALRAAGMDRDSASLLAGLTANDGDYGALAELGAELIRQGDELARAGDFEGAAQSYNAALELGQRVQASTAFMNEARAALILQESAANSLNQLSAYVTMSEETLNYLSQTNREIIAGFEQLGTLYQSMYAAIANGDLSGVAEYLSGIISGDLPLFFGL